MGLVLDVKYQSSHKERAILNIGSESSYKLLNRIIGFYLITVAGVIAVQFSVELVYESAPISPLQVWFVIDWFSLIGFVMCVWVNALYMRTFKNGDSATWGRVASSSAFYLSIALALAFLHNFVGSLAVGKDDLLFWKFINVVQIPLFAATGFRLTHQKRGKSVDSEDNSTAVS